MNWRNTAAAGLLLIGSTQMIGDLIGNRALKGIGAASAVAPSPKVFCDINGLEPFASTFVITIKDQETFSVPITPELYARLTGPYNRRNVYGAAIAGAPLLPATMRQSVLAYAFAPQGPLGQELGLTEKSHATLAIHTNTRGRDNSWSFACEQ
jgi:hypothetical protein